MYALPELCKMPSVSKQNNNDGFFYCHNWGQFSTFLNLYITLPQNFIMIYWHNKKG
mgnify:CR=1 FL=1